MQSEISAAPIMTRVKDATPVFAMSTGGALVPLEDRPKLTLSRMQVAVDAIESAEARAKAVASKATASVGKDGQSAMTRFADGPLSWMATIGLIGVVGWGAYHALDGFACIVGVVGGVVGTFFAAAFAIDKAVASSRRKMARATLEPSHLDGFAALHKAASERALERAAIGRVARELIGGLTEREIYHPDETSALLETIAQDDKLGDAAAQAELERHRNLITAFRGVATWQAGVDESATQLIEAFQNLTPDERTAIANELRNSLFEGEVPRGDGLSYPKAIELRKALTNP